MKISVTSRLSRRAPAFLPLVLLAAGSAQAQTASVNFIGNTDATQTENRLRPTETAGVVPVAYWNNDHGNLNSGTVSPIVDSSDATTGATFSFTAYDTQSNGLDTDPNFSTNPNYQLMNGYIESGPTTAAASAVITVGSVPYATYNLYVYMYNGLGYDSDPNPYSGAYIFQPSGGGASTEIDATRFSDFNGTFTQATGDTPGNYIVFSGLTASSFTLTAQSLPDGTQEFVPINGLQIVNMAAAPEPSGWAVLALGAGALGLLVVRRRRTEA